jgi:hypothetical protein
MAAFILSLSKVENTFQLVVNSCDYVLCVDWIRKSGGKKEPIGLPQLVITDISSDFEKPIVSICHWLTLISKEALAAHVTQQKPQQYCLGGI